MAETKTAPAKSTTSATLPKSVFGLEVKNHQLLYEAVRMQQANRRSAQASTLQRGQVRGGGKKPWRQKGTGNARAGSIRSPLWRGGGVTFGPTGQENYRLRLPIKAKRLALRQALSLKAQADQVKVIETFACPDGKVKAALDLLKKLDNKRNVLLAVSVKDNLVDRATRNVKELKAVQALRLSVQDILDSDTIVITEKALKQITEWLDPVRNRPAHSSLSVRAHPSESKTKGTPPAGGSTASGRSVSNGVGEAK